MTHRIWGGLHGKGGSPKQLFLNHPTVPPLTECWTPKHRIGNPYFEGKVHHQTWLCFCHQKSHQGSKIKDERFMNIFELAFSFGFVSTFPFTYPLANCRY